MNRFAIPPDWVGVIRTDVRWRKPYGWYDRNTRTIEVWPCGWVLPMFGLREKAIVLTWNHEALHAWGNPGCSKPWCLGFESSNTMENAATISQFLNGFRFCNDCMSYLPTGG